MSEEEIKRVFSKNLNYFLELNDKDPVDLVNDLNLPFSTVSSWCNGLKMPRMGNVEKLAKYFGIEKSDLIEERKENKYYLSEDVRQIAQELFERKELRILFDTTRKVKTEDIKYIQDLVDRLKDN